MRGAEDQGESDRSADNILAFNFLKNLANLAQSSFEDRESGVTSARKEACPVHIICLKRPLDGHFEGVPPTKAERVNLEKRKQNRHSAALNGKAVKENDIGMSVELHERVPPPCQLQSADESTPCKSKLLW